MTLPNQIVARPTLPVPHQRIHEGNHYFVYKISLDIEHANPKYYLIIPPPYIGTNTIEMNMMFEVVTDIGGTLQLFEDASVSANGTELYIVNNNRDKTILSGAHIYEDPEVTDEGLSIFEERKGTATSGAELGAYYLENEEIILDNSKKYLIKFTPLVDGANITMKFNWYNDRPSSPAS